jgi:heptaprenyl diphosphate synthase
LKSFPWPEHQGLNQQLSHLHDQLLDLAQGEKGPLKDMLEKLFQRRGKFLRGGFCLLAGWFTAENPQKVASAAMALEAFHLATLIHDDIIDGALSRRGAKTIHYLYGLREAVLLGDFLYSRALLEITPLLESRQEQDFCRSILQICRQEIQQSLSCKPNWSLREHKRRTAGKTAALFTLSLHSGAQVSNASEPIAQQLRRFGYNLGMAFQFIDDILDYSPRLNTGKQPYQDIQNGLTNLPLILCEIQDPRIKEKLDQALQRGKKNYILKILNQLQGLEIAKTMAEKYTRRAYKELDDLPEGEARELLLETANNCLHRNF